MDLSERINKTGKSVLDLTVGELVSLEAEQQRHFLNSETLSPAHQMSRPGSMIDRRSVVTVSGRGCGGVCHV